MSSVKDQILCLIWGRLPLLIFAKVTYLQNFFKAKLTWRSLGSSFERNVTGTKRAHLGLTWCILYTWLARYTWWQKRGGSFSCEAFQPAPDGCLPGGGDSAPGCHHLSTAAKRCFLVQSVQLCHVFAVVSSARKELKMDRRRQALSDCDRLWSLFSSNLSEERSLWFRLNIRSALMKMSKIARGTEVEKSALQ